MEINIMKIKLLLCFLMISSTLFPQWSRTNGPEGISISSLTNIGGTIYAGTSVDGICVSNDDGLSWIPMNTGIEAYEVKSVVSKSGYLFAGTFGYGVFRSPDGGQIWYPPTTGENLGVTSMIVSGDYILVGTISKGVYRSADNGDTWEPTILTTSSISSMCVTGELIIASSYGYTYGSTDHGENWFYIDDLEGGGVLSLYCNGDLIIAGAVNEIHRSTDHGNTFTTIPISFTFGIVNIYEITAIESMLFAATSYDGVYQSLDNGTTWAPANEGMGPNDARALVVSGASTLLAGTNYTGMYRSTDFGSNWNKSNDGFPAGSTIATLLANGTTLFAGTRGDGIHRTTDNGISWTKLTGTNDTINYSAVQGMCIKDNVIYAGTRLQFSATVYKSANNGQTWARCGSGIPSGVSFITGMATSENNIVASTDEGIYYSPDDGANWYLANAPTQHVPSISASGGYLYAAVPGIGIYRSPDNGVNWIVVLQSPGGDYMEVASIDNYVFAGTFFNGARYSTNYGSLWYTSSGFSGDASVFALGPVGDGMVLAGTDQSPYWIYASFDNGISYEPYSDGLWKNSPVESFTVNDSFMFAGADYNGVWRRLRPGLVNVPTEPILHHTFHLTQNFPNPFYPFTTIRYAIPDAGEIKLEVFNISGEKVSTLASEYKEAGNYEVTFDATELSSGIYFYRLETRLSTSVKKMILRE